MREACEGCEARGGGREAPARLVLAVDPGPESSAWVYLRRQDHSPLPEVWTFGEDKNADVEDLVAGDADQVDLFAVEGLAYYGARVGRSTFDTAEAIGRFSKAAEVAGVGFTKVTRPMVRNWLQCEGTDAGIRAKLSELYPSLKLKTTHLRAALGVGLTAMRAGR